MAHYSWFANRNETGKFSRIRRRRSPSLRPRLEPLEDRTLLTAYTFTRIADFTAAELSINNHGVVAMGDGVGGDFPVLNGIYIGDGGPVTPIALPSGMIRYFADPSINDLGMVAFRGVSGFGADEAVNGIYVSDGTAAPNPIETINGDYSDFGPPAINRRGEVVYSALGEFNGTINGALRFRYCENTVCPVQSPGILTTLVQGDEERFFFLNDYSSINDSGIPTVAYIASGGDTREEAGRERVLMTNGTTNGTTIADDQEEEFLDDAVGTFHYPVINNRNTVAFLARHASTGVDGLFIKTGGSGYFTVAEVGGMIAGFAGPPSINLAGTVAFAMFTCDTTPNGCSVEAGIYTGSDLTNDKVIAEGDTLFGQTVRDLGNPVINDCGQIAITVQFEDETWTVVRADPVGGCGGGGTFDRDADGVEDTIEDAAPNGDGNNDDVPDRDQPNVASLQSIVGVYVTIVSPDGTVLNEVRTLANPSPADAPDGTVFPIGFASCRLTGLSPGGAADVTILVHDGPAITSYWKRGSTPDNAEDHWYEFTHVGMTGAEVESGRVLLHFVDGARGDGDLMANGEIVDPGAPSVPAPPPDTAGPTILSVQLTRDARGKKLTGLVLNFSEDLDSLGAQTVAGNYELVSRNGRKTKAVAILSANYAARAVTLVPQKPIALKKLPGLVLTVRGNGTITDLGGNVFDGDSNGVPGGDFVVTGSQPATLIASQRRVLSAIDELLQKGELFASADLFA